MTVSHQNLIPVTINCHSKSVTKTLTPLQYTVIPSQSPKPYSRYNIQSFQVSHQTLIPVTIHSHSKSVTKTLFLLQYLRSKSVTKTLFLLQYTVIKTLYLLQYTVVPSQSPQPSFCYNTLLFQVSHHNLLPVTIHCCSKSTSHVLHFIDREKLCVLH